MKTKLFSAALLVSALLASSNLIAGPPGADTCEGLSGAARGLCRAGFAAGCADGSGNPVACMRIEERFSETTGMLPPWIEPPSLCLCDYSVVPMTAEAWSDESGNPKVIVLRCDATEAVMQANNPLPQTPVINTLFTTESPPQPICQALAQDGAADVAGPLTPEEMAACRNDVLDYAAAFLTLYPGWPWVDNCTVP